MAQMTSHRATSPPSGDSAGTPKWAGNAGLVGSGKYEGAQPRAAEMQMADKDDRKPRLGRHQI